MLTADLRIRLEEAAGAILTEFVPEEQGCTSIVRKIETAGGAFILKSASHPKYREWLKQEALVMKMLNAESFDWPIPRHFAFVETPEADNLLMSLEEGVTLTSALRMADSPVERRALLHSFGRFLQDFHNREPAACFRQEEDWLDRQLKQARVYVESGQSGGSLELLDSLIAGRPYPVKQTMIHGDCTTDNVLVRDGEVYRFIDLAGMTVGDPRYDEALAVRSFADNQEEREAFYSGYRRNRIDEAAFRYFNDGLYEFF